MRRWVYRSVPAGDSVGEDPVPDASLLSVSISDNAPAYDTNALDHIHNVARHMSLSAYADWETPELWLFKHRVDIERYLSGSSADVRLISLQQCREVMTGVYEAREKLSRKVKLEDTLEYQVYRLFGKKYGLRALVIKHASAFLSSVRYYATHDIDTAVFLAAFRNQIEEDFVHRHDDLRSSVVRLIGSMVLHSEGVLKDSSEFRAAMDSRMNGSMTELEWVPLVDALFRGEERFLLLRALQSVCDEMAGKEAQGHEGGVDEVYRLPVAELNTSSFQASAAAANSVRGRRGADSAAVARLGQAKSGHKVLPGNANPSTEARAVKARKMACKTLLHEVLAFHFKRHLTALFPFRECFRFYDSDADGTLAVSLCFVCLCNYYEECRSHAIMAGPANAENNSFCSLASLSAFKRFLASVDFDQIGFISFSNAVLILKKLSPP